MGDTVINGSPVEEADAKAARDLAKEREAALLRQEQEEQERQQREAVAARKLEAQKKAKESAATAEAERQRRKDALVARASSPPTFVPVYFEFEHLMIVCLQTTACSRASDCHLFKFQSVI